MLQERRCTRASFDTATRTNSNTFSRKWLRSESYRETVLSVVWRIIYSL